MAGKSPRGISRGRLVIARDFEVADSFFSRMRGLMFRSKPKAILFKFDASGRHSIHSLFVLFPFDAVYLDGGKRVVGVVRSIAPFTPLITSAAPARYLLELPAGSAKKNKIKIGEQLSF